jgi:hypothetical protein
VKHCHLFVENDWRHSYKDMLTGKREEFPHQFLPCYWPLEFTKRRRFNRQAENQTYIEWLQTKYNDGDDDGDEEEEEEEKEDVDGSSENEDKVDGHRDKIENKDENRNDDRDPEACNGHSNVEIFMIGMDGDENTLQYGDQVEQVAGFYKQASFTDLETRTTGKTRKSVALLDDRNDGGANPVKQGHCRPYLGPLTSQQLGKELSRKVAQISSSH